MAKDRRGKHGTRKVVVPDLSTSLIADAKTTLTNLGLNYSDTATNIGISADNNKVFEQSPAAGTVVIIGSTVSIGYYSYIAPPNFFGPPAFFGPPGFFGPPAFFSPPDFSCNPLQGQTCFRSAPGPGGTTCFYTSVYSCSGACSGGSLDFCL